MFVRLKTKSYCGDAFRPPRIHIRAYVVESYRRGGKPRQRQLCYLGSTSFTVGQSSVGDDSSLYHELVEQARARVKEWKPSVWQKIRTTLLTKLKSEIDRARNTDRMYRVVCLAPDASVPDSILTNVLDAIDPKRAVKGDRDDQVR